MKGDHRIFGNERLWEACFQREFNFLSQEESRVSNLISHLDEVFHGKICNGIRVRFATFTESREYRLPIRDAFIQQLQQDRDVFECAVEALPEKRNDRVRSVSNEKRLAIL